MKELSVEKRLVRLVREAGGLCPKGECEAGFPDRIAILPGGRTAYIELKQPHGALSELQKCWRDDLTDRGHEYWVCWNHEEVDRFAKTL